MAAIPSKAYDAFSLNTTQILKVKELFGIEGARWIEIPSDFTEPASLLGWDDKLVGSITVAQACKL
jgi:hypothetical protein